MTGWKQETGQPFTYLADHLTEKASHLTYILLYDSKFKTDLSRELIKVIVL